MSTIDLDALEAVAAASGAIATGPVLDLIARVRELEAIVNDGGNQAAKYWTRLTAAEREMHARELHHFEEEKLRAEAEAERDRYREAIEKALAFESVLPAIASEPRRILTSALNDKEAEK